MEEEAHQPANSIELARTKEGHRSYHIKCRGDDKWEIAERIIWWDDFLNEKYPVKVKDVSPSTE